MKRGTPEHPKVMDFAEAVHGKLAEQGIELPFELAHSLACGMVERLWHYTARYAPAGDIGKHSDLRISIAMGWKYDATWLVNALVDCKVIDSTVKGCRLYVHDWHDHSDDAADKWLHDKGLQYANGHCTRRGKKSRPSHDSVATQSRQPEPEPKPSSEPESSSYPRPEPSPEVETASRSRLDESFDEDKAEHWALDIAKQLPPRNGTDVRRWCAIAIAAQTTFSEDWFRSALFKVKTGRSEKGPYAHFNSILNKSAAQKHVPDLKRFLNSIAVPESLQSCLQVRARAP